MAMFGHTNQSGPDGKFQGRFGSYEVSVRDRPDSWETEIAMCFEGCCVSNLYNESELHRIQRTSGGPMREHVFEMVARQLDIEIEKMRHQNMVSMAAAGPSAAMYATRHPQQVQHQIREAEFHQRKMMEEYERKMMESMRVPDHMMNAPPKVNININTNHKPKKTVGGKVAKTIGGKVAHKTVGTLREQLQAETDEWLKEVKAA